MYLKFKVRILINIIKRDNILNMDKSFLVTSILVLYVLRLYDYNKR